MNCFVLFCAVIQNSNNMNSTHITHEITDYSKLANRVLRAMRQLTGCNCGTVSNPMDEASYQMADGRTIMQTIKEDGYIMYNDGYLIVECDYYTIYVDYSGRAAKEYNLNEYKCISNVIQ